MDGLQRLAALGSVQTLLGFRKLVHIGALICNEVLNFRPQRIAVVVGAIEVALQLDGPLVNFLSLGLQILNLCSLPTVEQLRLA